MAINVELRKSDSTTYAGSDNLIYLKTSVGLIDGLLDNNDKIKSTLLPSWVAGSMRFVQVWDGVSECSTCDGVGRVPGEIITCGTCAGSGEVGGLTCGTCAGSGTVEMLENCEICGGDGITETWNYTLKEANSLISRYVGINGGSVRGCFLIISSDFTLNVTSGYTLYNEEKDSTSTTLEKGDWLICVSDDGNTWGIINNTYESATTEVKGIVQLATESEGSNGTISTKAMTPKATVAAINARAYSHPTHTAKNETFSAVETLSALSVNSLGHVTSFSKQAIRVASEAQTGVIRLASSSEAKAATDDTKATSPLRVKEMIDKFASIELVQSLPTNMTDHPAGKLIMLQL